jgi:16S rRNA (cytidine1402-2'-O)-methyltransferase
MFVLPRVYGLPTPEIRADGLNNGRDMGTLFVVATPIGNLEDITTRALRVLKEVSLIAAEDTRHTGKLLAHFEIDTPMISYHAFNERSRRERLLESLRDGDVALVTDAGTPAISDPGAELVDAALDAGFTVRTIPGASSLAAAASVSGLLAGPFTFLGFLPRKAGERVRLVARAAGSGFGLILFESPNRLQETLQELTPVLNGRRFAVARELSKLHEEVRRGVFATGDQYGEFGTVRGEIVLLVEASSENERDEDPREVLGNLLKSGLKPSDAAREAASLTGRTRSELYQLALELGRAQKEIG